MKHSLLVAALLALAVTACGKKEAPPAPAAAPARPLLLQPRLRMRLRPLHLPPRRPTPPLLLPLPLLPPTPPSR